LFLLAYPELSSRIFNRILQPALEAGVDLVLTTCSGCLMQWQAGTAGTNIAVKHLVTHLACWLARGDKERGKRG
jgi:Fe-S oxidoreductase